MIEQKKLLYVLAILGIVTFLAVIGWQVWQGAQPAQADTPENINTKSELCTTLDGFSFVFTVDQSLTLLELDLSGSQIKNDELVTVVTPDGDAVKEYFIIAITSDLWHADYKKKEFRLWKEPQFPARFDLENIADPTGRENLQLAVSVMQGLSHDMNFTLSCQ